MSKRKYTKRNLEYWNSLGKKQKNEKSELESEDYEPAIVGEGLLATQAAYERAGIPQSGEKTKSRINRSSVRRPLNRFSQIRSGLLPYELASDGVNVRDAIELCQKAYANIPIYRNTVDMMSEFANATLYLEGGSEKSRMFFEKLFEKIKIWDLKDQFFREYYRSGNIFLYRVDGKFQDEDFRKISQTFSGREKNNKFPLKYILLNPFEIVAKRSTIFSSEDGAYAKILSEFDMERLANPKNQRDQEIFNAFSPEIRKQIKDGAYFKDGLKIQLENERLVYSFYKKQDYEPFAIPFGYPVLEDINAKLEMKKMDQAIMRTVENVILMITMGAEPDKGGINSNNIKAMQNLFQNESVGRVLVSDYTTKADFVIPDINKVVGPQKYEVINQDIKEGLQNIILNEEKYSGVQIKARVFLDRLKEAREAFINDFLQPEIKRVAQDFGFQSYPKAKFQDIDLRDEVQLMRVATRLMELGIVTAEQGMEIMQTGQFPDGDELEQAQEKFVDQRKKGYFNPIVGGQPMIEEIEDNTPVKKGNPQQAGRPPEPSEASYSREDIQSTIYEIENLMAVARTKMKEKLKIGKNQPFNSQQEKMISELCQSVVCSTEKENWSDQVISCVNDFNVIEKLGVIDEILDISDEHKLEIYPSSILYHSKKHQI